MIGTRVPRSATSFLLMTFSCILHNMREAASAPLCLNHAKPIPISKETAFTFCTHLNRSEYGVCCTEAEESKRQKVFIERLSNAVGELSPRCISRLIEISCAVCDPWAAYIYQLSPSSELNVGFDDGLKLSKEYCEELVAICDGALPLTNNYCEVHNDRDYYYSVPTDIGPDKRLQPAFPNMVLTGKISTLFLHSDSNLWWILNQAGSVIVFKNDVDVSDYTQIMSLDSKVSKAENAGILGGTLHPNFERNGVFYISYVDSKDNLVVSRFTHINGDAEATLESEVKIFTWPNPAGMNYGGWVGFPPSEIKFPGVGPHHLFLAVGDFSSNDDTKSSKYSQDLAQPYGKILRLLISEKNSLRTNNKIPLYTAPPDNALSAVSKESMSEIYAYGFHNPKCSFDRDTDQLICTDNGLSRIEEVNIVYNGYNYGWGLYEGDICIGSSPKNPCTLKNTSPAFQYCHPDFKFQPTEADADLSKEFCQSNDLLGQDISAGFVYRGTEFANDMYGEYIFADNGSKVLGRAYFDIETKSYQGRVMADERSGLGIVTSFAEDDAGELYVALREPTVIYRVPCTMC